MRGRHVGFHTQNPRNPARQRPDTTRIRVKGVPLSADDGQIRRTLEVMIKVRDGEILHMHFIAAGSTIAPIVLYISTCVTHMGFVALTLPKMSWSCCTKIGLTVFGLPNS
jgi:hypothetical protein